MLKPSRAKIDGDQESFLSINDLHFVISLLVEFSWTSNFLYTCGAFLEVQINLTKHSFKNSTSNAMLLAFRQINRYNPRKRREALTSYKNSVATDLGVLRVGANNCDPFLMIDEVTVSSWVLSIIKRVLIKTRLSWLTSANKYNFFDGTCSFDRRILLQY